MMNNKSYNLYQNLYNPYYLSWKEGENLIALDHKSEINVIPWSWMAWKRKQTHIRGSRGGGFEWPSCHDPLQFTNLLCFGVSDMSMAINLQAFKICLGVQCLIRDFRFPSLHNHFLLFMHGLQDRTSSYSFSALCLLLNPNCFYIHQLLLIYRKFSQIKFLII